MAKRSIGDVIKKAREKKELRADAVAVLCYVSRARVYQWEKDTYIHPKNLLFLAEALGLKLKYLQAINGERTSEQPAAAQESAAA